MMRSCKSFSIYFFIKPYCFCFYQFKYYSDFLLQLMSTLMLKIPSVKFVRNTFEKMPTYLYTFNYKGRFSLLYDKDVKNPFPFGKWTAIFQLFYNFNIIIYSAYCLNLFYRNVLRCSNSEEANNNKNM